MITVRSGVVAIAIAVLSGGLVAVGPTEDASAAPVEAIFTERIDAHADYDGPESCSPTAKPGAVALLNLLSATYPGTGGYISRSCSGVPTSEHQEGRAIDWMISAEDDQDLADDFLDWLLATDAYGNEHAMLRRLGIMYLIWDHRVWRAYDPDEGWQPYSGPNPHTDHIHISMSWDGALERTTWLSNPELGRRLDQARLAATWRDEQRLDVFRRSEAGELQVRVWNGHWLDWEILGGSLDSGPAAVWSSSRSLWVFAQGDDGNLHQRRWRKAGGWGAWKETDVPITAAPGVTTHDKGIQLFVRTPSGSLSYRSWVPRDQRGATEVDRRRNGWSSWEDLGGILSAPPAAVWRTPTEMDVFVRGTAGLLHQKVFSDGVWSADWITLGGTLTSGPAAMSRAPGEVSVYVRTTRGTISERNHVGVWSDWIELGGMHVSGPSATAIPLVRRDLFTRARDGGLTQNYSLDGTGWSGWGLR